MAMEKIGDGLKKILLVGIGAAATTVEKSSQIIDDLVKKGETRSSTRSFSTMSGRPWKPARLTPFLSKRNWQR